MGVVLAALALLLPGLAFWLWLGPRDDDLAQAAAKVIGHSISLTALVALALTSLRLRLTPLFLALLLLLLGVLCLIGLMRRLEWAGWQAWTGLLLGFGLLLAWRFWQARSLVLPNWTDSLHHALITRVFIERGALPLDLQPYLPINLYYHFGFHSFTALFATLAGIEAPQAVLTLGNLLMAAASLSVYALAKELSKNTPAAIAAAAISAFLLRMPGFYLTWGRYTLLTGMLLLPLVIAETQAVLAGRRKPWQALGLGLLFAGCILGHYFMVLLLGLYFVLAGLNWAISSLLTRSWNWKTLFAFILPLGLASLGLLPWFLRVRALSAGVNNTEALRVEAVDRLGQWTYLGQLLGPGLGVALAVLAALAALYCILERRYRTFGLWALATGALALPTGLYLVSFRSDYFTMTLYLAQAVCLALAGAWAYNQIAARLASRRLELQAIGQAAFLVLLFIGAIVNADPINPVTVLANRGDLDVLDWVGSHIPQEARFFVNTAPWGWGYQRGVDGGAWLLPKTGNWSLAPTIFYSQTQDSDLVEKLNDWAIRAAKVSACETDFWELVEEADLSYVYAREGVGSLQPVVLDHCAGLERLYKSDGVGLWLIKAQP